MTAPCEHRTDQQTYDAEAKLFTCDCGMVRENDDAAVFHNPVVAPALNPHETNASDLKAHIAAADLAALDALEIAVVQHPDCEGVRITISQPNANHEDGFVRTVEYTRDQILEFEAKIKEAALATDAPNAPRRAGEHCTYCPAKTRCPEFEQLMMDEAAEDFGFDPADGPMPTTLDVLMPTDMPRIDPENIVALIRKSKLIPLFDQWGRDVKAAIMHHLVNGVPVPGKKLVHGKSNRKFPDTDAVELQVNKQVPGFPLVDLWTPQEFKSPAQVEKLGADKAQRKLFKEIVAELAIKPPGKISVADETDPRPAVDVGEEAILEFDDGESVSGVAE